MEGISRLSWNLQNADLRAKEKENGLWIMDYSRLIRVGLNRNIPYP